MSDTPKLTIDDVLRLQDAANRMPPAANLDARRQLMDAVKDGPGAFSDDAVYAYAKHLVDTYFPVR
jgi:hypothetical protein